MMFCVASNICYNSLQLFSQIIRVCQGLVSRSSLFHFQILARFSPLLLSGTEEDLVNLLKDDDEAIKEGILNVLAKAGGTIRENLAASSRFNC